MKPEEIARINNSTFTRRESRLNRQELNWSRKVKNLPRPNAFQRRKGIVLRAWAGNPRLRRAILHRVGSIPRSARSRRVPTRHLEVAVYHRTFIQRDPQQESTSRRHEYIDLQITVGNFAR